MARYCKITDGTTGINLDGTSDADFFGIQWGQWAPKVARQNLNTLGGNLYDDVIEEIPLEIKSTTDIATILENIEALNNLINQAERWYRGENVDPVIFRYSPNSNSAYYEAAILGPPGGQSAIELPPTFEGYLQALATIGVTLRFIRHGQWLDDEDTASGSTVKQGVKGSVTFSAAPDTPSPVKVEINPEDTGALPTDTVFSKDIFMFFGNDSDDIEVSDLSGTSDTYALGGAYLSLSANTSEQSTSWQSLSGNMPDNNVAMYAVMEATTNDVYVRLLVNTYTISDYYKFTNWVRVPAGDKLVMYLGNVSFRAGGALNKYKISYKTESGSATLDVDYVSFFNVANPYNSMIKIIAEGEIYQILTIDHSLLTLPVPLISFQNGYPPGYLGQPIISAENTTLYYLYMGVDSAEWRNYDASNVSDIQDYEYSFKLRPGVQIPR